MPFPAGLTLVSVHGRFDSLPDGGASGRACFECPYTLLGPTDNSIVAPFRVYANLDADGEFTVDLPANNDPDWTPVDWAYTVRAVINGATITGTLQLDYQTPSVELSDLLQVDGAAEAGTTYATLAQLATVQTDLGAAEADIATLTTGLATASASANLAVAGSVRASDHNLTGWTFDPALAQAGTVQPTAGLAQVARVRMLSSVVTNLHLHFTAGGSGLTGAYMALYNDAGALLGGGAVTADQSATWGTSGLKTCPLAVAQGVTPYAWYRVLWWFTGTTGPTISRGSDVSAALLNAGLSAPTLRYATADSGLTTAAPGNIGTQTGGGTAWWVGVS